MDLLSYSSTVSAAVQLVLKGCIHFTSFQFRPYFGIKDFRITQCGRPAEPVFQSSRILLTSSLWDIILGRQFHVVIEGAEVNCLMNDSGLLHIVRLLQDIGYMQETVASDSKRPDFVIGGERVEVTQYEVAKPTFRADVRVLTAHLVIADGTILLPSDAAAVLGAQAAFFVAIGAANIRRHADDVEGEYDCSWLTCPPMPPAASTIGKLGFPMLGEVKSDGLQATLRCWRTRNGLLLQEPVKARLRLTEALTTCCLAKITPMLQYVAKIKDARDIVCELTPLDMQWPCETIALRFEPMRLFLHCRKLLKSLLHVVSRDQVELIKAGVLEAWTSGVEAQWWREGFIESHRIDIVVGMDLQNKRRMHCAMWGRVSTAHDNAMDMTLGLPADTLAVYGIKDLPKEFMLDIKVSGTAQNPHVDWPRAVGQLGKLYAHRMLDQAHPLFQMLNPFKRNSSSAQQQQQQMAHGKPPSADPLSDSPKHSDVVMDLRPPPPTLPLPWDAFQETEPADKPQGRAP
ncbi:hypothetical protein WJX84_011774 [Apatococcus fuscideae]|uniref:Uncharacterized protein n=1 Tax=Apatococcus fuscideae TaxID=2026836 RepID=A0AAW1T1C8_9CHLO